MKFKTILLITLIALASLFVSPATASAKPARVGWNKVVIEVVEELPSSWDVRGAVEDIDWYTGSDLRLVKYCSGKNRCVTIYSGSVTGKRGNPIGWSFDCPKSKKYCSIKIDTKRAAKSRTWNGATKRWLIRHELGHYHGLGHRKACDSTMNEYVRCRGKVPPNVFTSAQRAALRKR